MPRFDLPPPRRTAALAWLTICMGLSACGSPHLRKQEFSPPIVTITERTIAGTFLAPAREPPNGAASETSVIGIVRARWVATEQAPEAHTPLGAGTQVVADPTRAARFVAAPQLAAGIQYERRAAGSDPRPRGHRFVLGIAEVALIADTTTVLAIELAPSVAVNRPGDSRWDRAEVLLRVPTNASVGDLTGVELSLRLVGEAIAIPSAAEALDDAVGAPLAVDELVIFAESVGTASGRLTLPRRATEAGSVAGVHYQCELEFIVDSASIAQARTASSPSTRPASGGTMTDAPDAQGLSTAELEVLRQGLRQPNQQRAALLRLAVRVDSRLGQDVALVATRSQLTALCEAVAAGIDAEAQRNDPGRIALRIECTLLREFASAVELETLPTEFESLLIRHTGQAARQPTSLRELAANATSLLDLQGMVEIENLLFLQDSAPSARVRAYDWLRSRDRAPAGFDLLGPTDERRAAIQKALESATMEDE